MPAEPAPRPASSPELPRRAQRLPLPAAHAGLAIVYDLGHHLILALTLFGSAFLWLGQAARRAEGSRGPLTSLIVAGALLLRLPLLPLPLSDDALHYVWDGKMAAAGYNPYALAPDARKLTLLRDDSWRRLQHRQVPTVSPRPSVAALSIAARLPFPILARQARVAAAAPGLPRLVDDPSELCKERTG